MNVEIVTIGDELLLGFTVDSNAAHLARALAAEGVRIVRRATVGDAADDITAAVREALERTGAVITTGGLGPTSDDRTKESIAALFGLGMAIDSEHLAWMRERWRTRWNAELPASNERQALLPDGARKLVNNHGSAPGIWLEDARGWVAMLPGVPREMRGMLADTLLPLVRERIAASGGAPVVVRSRTLRTTGVAESLLADRLRAAEASLLGVELAYIPNPDGVDLRLTISGVGADEAEAALGAAAANVRDAVGEAIYGEDAADLAAVVLDGCRSRGLTLAVAESCTGGLLGARLTAIPGSSDVVLGGTIAYHNDVKVRELGVDAAVLREHGAVSEPVVRAMAEGVRARAGAGVALAITGVAGPGGGTAEKPVGTVWIALATADRIVPRRLNLWGDRAEVRHRAAQAAMELLRRELLA